MSSSLYHVKLIATLFISLGNVLYTPAISANDWVLYKEDASEDIKISFRESQAYPGLVEFKGITGIRSKLSTLVAVIRDVEDMKNWVYQVKEATELKRVSDTERYTYIIHNTPFWGFDERDSVVHSILSQNPATLEVTFKGKSAPDKVEKNNMYERISHGESMWKFTPLGNNLTRVTFQGFANPGGVVEKLAFSFMVKRYLWRLPMETLRNLKTQVKKKKYSNINYSFIKDPA